ncbi:hypothetical protein C8J57DRAFT_1250553 [Mycena rebaudengoi]|nr:hypothetical protein C8J57DRAFT_1250553 [Mycena rebaudengoi]
MRNGDTIRAAAPAALCATVSLFCDLYYNLLGRLDAVTPLLLISNMMAAKLYAISAMWTLNSRRDLRSQLSTVVSTGPSTVSEKFASSGQTTDKSARIVLRIVDQNRLQNPYSDRP